jgi:CoA:oxalate CoA-transferase
MARSDDPERSVITPGNPVKMSGVTPEPDRRVPWLGEHTDQILRTELNLSAGEISALRASGVVA